jgi:hypothetical protein
VAATFQGLARFGWTVFEGPARFDKAAFRGDADFREATFRGDAGFDDVEFRNSASFKSVRFDGTLQFGPLLAGHVLVLDDVRFAQPTRIEASAPAISCRRARFPAGVRFRLRWTRVVLG